MGFERATEPLDFFGRPKGGPPLHVHHKQEETIHVLKGRYKIRIGDDIFYRNKGCFAYLPLRTPTHSST